MRMSIPVIAAGAALVAFFAILPTPAAPPPDPHQPGASFLLRDVRLFDGEGFVERSDVLVRDGRVAAVGARLARPPEVPEYAAPGHTLLPGLVDAHTHSFGDARRQALRFGVAVEIEMFGQAARLPELRASRESLEATDAADLWSAGTLVTARGGHGTQFGLPIPTLDDAADADAFVAARIDEGSDFIKLVLESGHGWGRAQATLDDATLRAAIAAAHRRGKRAVVHVSTLEEARQAVDAGADGLVHVFADTVVDADRDAALIDAMRARDVFVVATLAVLESASDRDSGLAADPQLAPWLDDLQRAGLARRYPPSPSRAELLARATANVAALHAAGIDILAGSDAPNPGTAHGASLHRELELLVAAGLTPTQALAAATSRPAARFGLPERGRIAAGMRADLLLVDGDPREDIRATRAITAVWKNGRPVSRARQDAPAAADASVLADPVLTRFADGRGGWEPTTDRMQGGQSEVSLQRVDGGLQVDAGVRAGAPWPWAGAMRALGSPPMSAVDVAAHDAIVIDYASDEPLTLLLFSGAAMMPQTMPLPAQPGRGRVRIAFADVAGFAPAQARAVGIVAGPAPGSRTFVLHAMELSPR